MSEKYHSINMVRKTFVLHYELLYDDVTHVLFCHGKAFRTVADESEAAELVERSNQRIKKAIEEIVMDELSRSKDLDEQ